MTATTIPNQPVTYALLVIFTVNHSSGERLKDQQDIRDEAEHWLVSLQAFRAILVRFRREDRQDRGQQNRATAVQ
jgi:hypothetical protein